MKTFFITALFIIGIGTNLKAQKIDFSINLANDGGVHTNNSTAIDKDGNIFVAGGTKDSLKVTEDAYQKKYAGHDWVGGGDIFLMKLSPDGELIYSTYIGGSENEYYCNQITLDDDGNVYVGFTTSSKDLLVADNAYQKTNKGEQDHYIIKFSNDCKYISSTYLGGANSDHWTRLAVNNNTLYLIGCTKSEDFPTTAGVIQDKYNIWTASDSLRTWMEKDITITALSLNLDKVFYSTYFGGNNYEAISAFSFDKNGNIIIAGSTKSDDFPTSKTSFDQSYNGDYDGFLTIINPSFSEIKYSTFIGGELSDEIMSMAIYNSKKIILAGKTRSSNFPLTSDATKTNIGGRNDGFIAKLNIKTNKLVYSSYLGGSGGDGIEQIEMTRKKKLLLVGRTGSTDFPITEDALQQSYNGGGDMVVLKLDKSLKAIEYSSYLGGSKYEVFPKTSLSNNDKLILSFTSNSSDFSVSKKHAELDKTYMNILLKIDMNKE